MCEWRRCAEVDLNSRANGIENGVRTYSKGHGRRSCTIRLLAEVRARAVQDGCAAVLVRGTHVPARRHQI